MSQSDFLYEKIAGNFPYEPSEDQTALFRVLADFMVQYEESDLMLVNGYAGTGKTSALAAFIRTLKELEVPFVLMAPTGRAAKVLSSYTGFPAYTVHKQIYRQKSLGSQELSFSINYNKSRDTVYVVDESSLITIDSGNSVFGSGNVLEDLLTYVRSGEGNKLILVGDDAQLPPIGMDMSPALNLSYMSGFGPVMSARLKDVLRQGRDSGILYNATLIRKHIAAGELEIPGLDTVSYGDVFSISGSDLIETLSDNISTYGIEEVAVLCRSNKRANLYNRGIRATVLFCEEKLVRGDRLMVVKNCYKFLENVPELSFIANGDVAELVRVRKYEQRYGLNFADVTLSFPDYDDVEINAKIILDTLDAESASLSQEQQRALYEGVFADYENIKSIVQRRKAVREDVYYNALQVKYATAMTAHKSQGGQWKAVFIDNPFWGQEITLDDLKWLYTAFTRATERVYLVNFKLPGRSSQ